MSEDCWCEMIRTGENTTSFKMFDNSSFTYLHLEPYLLEFPEPINHKVYNLRYLIVRDKK